MSHAFRLHRFLCLLRPKPVFNPDLWEYNIPRSLWDLRRYEGLVLAQIHQRSGPIWCDYCHKPTLYRHIERYHKNQLKSAWWYVWVVCARNRSSSCTLRLHEIPPLTHIEHDKAKTPCQYRGRFFIRNYTVHLLMHRVGYIWPDRPAWQVSWPLAA